jgi:hypothetical protein
MAEHSSAPLGQVHIPYNWSYADATTRNAATGMVTADVGKFARQLDNNTIWMLIDDSPTTWISVAGSGASVTAVANYTRAVGTGNYSTSSTSYVDIDGTNLSLTLTTGAHRCMILFSASMYGDPSNNECYIQLDIDGNDVGEGHGIAELLLGSNQETKSIVFVTEPLSAASHTFKLHWKMSAGTGYIYNATAIVQFSIIELLA